MNNIDSSLSMT